MLKVNETDIAIPEPPKELFKAEEARRKSYENFPLKSRFIKEINKAISEGLVRACIEISSEEYDKYSETIYSWLRELKYHYHIIGKGKYFSEYIVEISWTY